MTNEERLYQALQQARDKLHWSATHYSALVRKHRVQAVDCQYDYIQILDAVRDIQVQLSKLKPQPDPIDDWRRLVQYGIKNIKNRPRSTPCFLWSMVASTFGIGSTRAYNLCKIFGENPDEIVRHKGDTCES